MTQMILSPNKQMERRLVFSRGYWGEKGVDGDLGVGRCKPLHLEQKSNVVILYSTRDCVQSLGLEHDRR